eukprot:TRINITY_DN14757_c0_g1_i1.p1 TRINITY_DN14757_c0_g1~~TRINITY_DN14757_c0_g1_i1.p1  ORF type:complete len:55 (+),score=3.95 TRINITY_DN14757_c0_g1_i1:735-899(+)
MEACRCYHFCQFFHVIWFDIHNNKTRLTDIEIPQIYSQIVSRDICFAVTINDMD